MVKGRQQQGRASDELLGGQEKRKGNQGYIQGRLPGAIRRAAVEELESLEDCSLLSLGPRHVAIQSEQ
jgi:hypothetical protein